MAYQVINVATHDRVGVITLNRPQVLNALNDVLMDELGQALLTFDADAKINVIVITGGEKVFAAGADIAAMKDMDYSTAYREDFITRNWEILRRIRKPVIAAVAGFALGGGCELALMCDMIIAADNAKFGQPEVKLGILPGAGGTQRLPRAVGKAKAMDMCLTARTINAQEAESVGLISRVVPAGALLEETMRIAQTIASYSQPALMKTKEAINRAYQSSLDEGLLFERRMFHAAFATQDQKEGMRAFLEKRQPVFRDA